MAKYISLDAVLAEIEKIIADETESIKSFEHSKNVSEVQRSNARIGVLTHLRSLLDTLEVKEVDLDFMLHEYWNISPKICVDCLESATMTKDEMIKFAKHFFELGLKTQKGE